MWYFIKLVYDGSGEIEYHAVTEMTEVADCLYGHTGDFSAVHVVAVDQEDAGRIVTEYFNQ